MLLVDGKLCTELFFMNKHGFNFNIWNIVLFIIRKKMIYKKIKISSVSYEINISKS